MGNCRSSTAQIYDDEPPCEWKVIKTIDEERANYKSDLGLPSYRSDDQVVWKNLIGEPSIQNLVTKCGAEAGDEEKSLSDGVCLFRKTDMKNMFSCWNDINEFRTMSVDRQRRQAAAVIFQTYLAPGALQAFSVPDDIVVSVRTTLQDAVQERVDDENGKRAFVREALDKNVFSSVQSHIFEALYEEAYLVLKNQDNFIAAVQEIKAKYNQISANDFEFYSPKLGEGGFGVVVRCKKLSTGKMYAMKVQRKIDLLGTFRENMKRVDLEVRVLAALRHNFLTSMDYAFQTEMFACIAMELAEGGTLESVQEYFIDGCVPEEYLKFYAAEICDAYNYLHRIGLIYRDMKPQNVLIDAQGHIKLADLGGVADTTRGKAIPSVSGKSYSAFPFAPKFGTAQPTEDVENLTNPRRRKSIMGTRGYMAPEMVELRDSDMPREGYCYSVDYWSLGVLLYALRLNTNPFGESLRRISRPEDEYAAICKPVEFPVMMLCSEEITSLIRSFLQIKETERLGYGLHGYRNIRNHPFFEGINWDDISMRRAKPPLDPTNDLSIKLNKNYRRFVNFDDMICQCVDNDTDLLDPISAQKQKFFQHWDFVSPTALRVEYGKANELKQYDENEKLHSVLGDIYSQPESRSMFSSLAFPTVSSHSSLASTPVRRNSRQSVSSDASDVSGHHSHSPQESGVHRKRRQMP